MLYSRYRIYFYRTAAGRCQACDYARELDVHHKAAAKRAFIGLSRMGPELPQDLGKYLRGGIWELRVVAQHHQHRFLYAFREDIALVTNAFLKKTWQVPENEIERALNAKADWLGRRAWEDL